jgi:polyisoprenoid-binding protein YceI
MRERWLRCLIWSLLVATIPAEQTVLAGVIHLEADTRKTEIHATVAEPLSAVRDQATTTGKFDLISGTIDGDPDNVAMTGHVKLVIDATSFDSGLAMRDRTVIGSALETARYQQIVFDSVRLEDVQVEVPGVSGSATVVGNLTLHGTTKPMRVPVRVSMSTDGEFSAGGETSFKYTDFGVKVPRLFFALPASDEVTVAFRIIAYRPGAAEAPQQSRRPPIRSPAVGEQSALR